MVIDEACKYPIKQAVKHALIAFIAATAKARRCDEGSSKRGIAAAKAGLYLGKFDLSEGTEK